MANSIYTQTLLGIQCADFVMIAADQTNTHSIILMKNDEEKIHLINDKLVMALAGAPGDAAQLAQFVCHNMDLYKMRNGYELGTAAVVHFTRKNLVDALKAGNPTILNMLVAGYDNEVGGQLFSLDMVASCVKVPFAVHGFGGYLCLGILDRYHNFMLTEDQAYDIMKLCVQEIHQRLFLSLPNFQVTVVCKDGIKEYPKINCFSFPREK